MVELVCQHSQNIRSLCLPKRFRLPPGYAHPEEYLIAAFSASHTAMTGKVITDHTSAAIYFTTDLLIRYQMPTYFVSAGLCEALLNTEAPEDMMFTELPQLMPAMLFMLPLEFSQRYFGELVPYITTAFVPHGHRPRNPIIVDGFDVSQMDWKMDGEGAPFVFMSTCLSWEDRYPMQYSGFSPIKEIPLKALMQTEIEHYAFADHEISEQAHKHDTILVNRLTNLAVNILLAMAAEPELVTRETILEPSKKKDGKVVRKALWEPNFIGRSIRYEHHEPVGTHASPVPHWRRGHRGYWKTQRHGPQNSLRKIIWIKPGKPVYVGLKTEEVQKE